MALIERGAVLQAMARLIKRTEAGAQAWEVYEQGEDEYTTSTEKFLYYVSSRDGDGASPFAFEIWRKIPDATTLKVGEFSTTSTTVQSIREANGELSRLFSLAKASAFGVAGLEADLLSDLE